MSTKNFWGDRFRLFCNHQHFKTDELGNKVKDPIEFVTQEGKSLFYTCPKYWAIDEQHPLGHHEDEHQCRNNLGFQDFEKIVSFLEKEYEKQIENGEFIIDLTDFKFSIGQIDVTVLYQDSEDNLYLGIVNKRSIYG